MYTLFKLPLIFICNNLISSQNQQNVTKFIKILVLCIQIENEWWTCLALIFINALSYEYNNLLIGMWLNYVTRAVKLCAFHGSCILSLKPITE